MWQVTKAVEEATTDISRQLHNRGYHSKILDGVIGIRHHFPELLLRRWSACRWCRVCVSLSPLPLVRGRTMNAAVANVADYWLGDHGRVTSTSQLQRIQCMKYLSIEGPLDHDGDDSASFGSSLQHLSSSCGTSCVALTHTASLVWNKSWQPRSCARLHHLHSLNLDIMLVHCYVSGLKSLV